MRAKRKIYGGRSRFDMKIRWVMPLGRWNSNEVQSHKQDQLMVFLSGEKSTAEIYFKIAY